MLLSAVCSFAGKESCQQGAVGKHPIGRLTSRQPTPGACVCKRGKDMREGGAFPSVWHMEGGGEESGGKD